MMEQLDNSEIIPPGGIRIYATPSVEPEGFLDLVLADTELEKVRIHPSNPLSALDYLKERRIQNAKYFVPFETTSLVPIVDGFRRGGLEGDIIGGTIEIMAGIIIEISIFTRGMQIQQRIELLNY